MLLSRFAPATRACQSIVVRTPLSFMAAPRPFSDSAALREQQESTATASAAIQHVTPLEKMMSLSDKLQNSIQTERNRLARATIAPEKLRRAPGGFRGASSSLASDDPPLPEFRTMQDSYVEVNLKFSESETLREQYVGASATVRMGRLMEDFDGLAATSAYRHVLPDSKTSSDAAAYQLYLVTAAVDRMDMLRGLADSSGHVPDLRLSGHVSYTTESSLEVLLRLSTIPTATEKAETILLGRFAMACRSTKGGKQKIAQLKVTGQEEQTLWDMGKQLRDTKQKRSLTSLDKTPPTVEEAKIMHDLFVGRAKIFERNAPTPESVVWMSDTNIKSATMMHPQERNVHNKIFGGHLMRLAYEAAYSTACLFARTPVTFLSLDELRFALPVEIGSLLILDSRVTYAPTKGEHRSFHVSVEAGTTDLRTGEKKITNTFHFTFESDQPLKRYVLPRSYKQAMQWLDSQRRRALGIEVRKSYE